MARRIDVQLEVAEKKAFATAVEWPGWSRSGRDRDAALAALLEYAPRYARAIAATHVTFVAPERTADLVVVEQVKGNASTEFGVPSHGHAVDAEPLGEAELRRLTHLLAACWRAFDDAADAARGRTLRTGPRGGGRDLDRIRTHVIQADQGYLGSIGGRLAVSAMDTEAAAAVRAVTLDALGGRVRGEVPDQGPRGGKRWTPRYAIRRSAWHALDHAWEIEDRADT